MGIIYKNRKKYSGDRKVEQYPNGEILVTSFTLTAGSTAITVKEFCYQMALHMKSVLQSLPTGYLVQLLSTSMSNLPTSTVYSTGITQNINTVLQWVERSQEASGQQREYYRSLQYNVRSSSVNDCRAGLLYWFASGTTVNQFTDYSNSAYVSANTSRTFTLYWRISKYRAFSV